MSNLGKFKAETLLPFVQFLLNAGADLNKRNNRGLAPLFVYDLQHFSDPRRDEEKLLRTLF